MRSGIENLDQGIKGLHWVDRINISYAIFTHYCNQFLVEEFGPAPPLRSEWRVAYEHCGGHRLHMLMYSKGTVAFVSKEQGKMKWPAQIWAGRKPRYLSH
ncbi:MAG: hypothetical protein AMXMBFR82_00360 [Candidatus Hydrogenedentota bacterium]